VTGLHSVIQPGPDGGPLRIRLSSLDSGGELGVVEMEMPAGSAGPPLHIHPTHGEGFYVLEGQLTLQIGQETITGGPGTWAFAPRNAPHALANHGTATARVLCVFAPGGFERRFERILAEQEGRQDILAELADLAPAERATQVTGPPIPPPNLTHL
jgi:quercetin dioxygenase-like cupin family protein